MASAAIDETAETTEQTSLIMPESKFEIGDEVYIERDKPGVVVNKNYELTIIRQQVSGLQIPTMAWSYQIIGFGFDIKEWYGEDTLTPSKY